MLLHASDGYIAACTTSGKHRREQYDGVIIPGRRAPEYIHLNEALPKIVRHFFEGNKPVDAICHAAQVLSVIPDLMKGR
jgi:protease I